MAVTAPDWLSSRGGSILESRDGHSWSVHLRGEPQYLLEPLPAQGKFSCRILQTINGKRLDGGGTWASHEEALKGGLEELRNSLGW